MCLSCIISPLTSFHYRRNNSFLQYTSPNEVRYFSKENGGTKRIKRPPDERMVSYLLRVTLTNSCRRPVKSLVLDTQRVETNGSPCLFHGGKVLHLSDKVRGRNTGSITGRVGCNIHHPFKNKFYFFSYFLRYRIRQTRRFCFMVCDLPSTCYW